jgi:hypothetical protein
MCRRFVTAALVGLLGVLILSVVTHAVPSMVEDARGDEYQRLSYDLDPGNKVLRWYDESKVKDYVFICCVTSAKR